MKHAVIVSDEMTTLVGEGALPAAPLPEDGVVFLFDGFANGAGATATYRPECDLGGAVDSELVFVVARSACHRLFPVCPAQPQSWYLPSALRILALAIVECDAPEGARDALRLARSIELLCQFHAALAGGDLVCTLGEGALSELDVARVAAARRAVDQRWHEKLTVAELARIAGINRDKLIRGFRELYGATIAEVLAERRLGEARRLLLASDLPVATIAYRCSYLNNASFTRAFSRRFGMAPSELRRIGIAA